MFEVCCYFACGVERELFERRLFSKIHKTDINQIISNFPKTYLSSYKVIGDSLIVNRSEINNLVGLLNKKSKPSTIFFFDGREINKITLPKYAMTVSNALNVLPKESQLKIASILKKMIIDKNTNLANRNRADAILFLKDVIEKSSYNKLEKQLGEANSKILQDAIKAEISKLPKEKQAYIKDIVM